MSDAYKKAGVDIDAGIKAVKLMKKFVKETYNDNVLAGVGSFGGMFKVGDKILVASADGVGTKLKLAYSSNKHDTVGQDLVNHCVNDILVQGATPLFFMDYFATSKLVPEVAAEIVKGFSKACKENGCVLLGGETAELPGIYKDKEYDLAGFIVGIVDKPIDGSTVKPGDKVIGLASTGLHTNGYSLALEVLGLEEHREDLMKVHKSYLNEVKPHLNKIKAMAHITGGGLIDNIPRVLPENCSVEINKNTWQTPKIFTLIQQKGDVKEQDMFRTFNMGIGFILIVDQDDSEAICKATKGTVIGEIIKGKKEVLIS